MLSRPSLLAMSPGFEATLDEALAHALKSFLGAVAKRGHNPRMKCLPLPRTSGPRAERMSAADLYPEERPRILTDTWSGARDPDGTLSFLLPELVLIETIHDQENHLAHI